MTTQPAPDEALIVPLARVLRYAPKGMSVAEASGILQSVNGNVATDQVRRVVDRLVEFGWVSSSDDVVVLTTAGGRWFDAVSNPRV